MPTNQRFEITAGLHSLAFSTAEDHDIRHQRASGRFLAPCHGGFGPQPTELALDVTDGDATG